MRLTFPYFIGPSTWCWHHALAERAAEWHDTKPELSAAVVAAFKEYMAAFVTMYPCPYCRHHLNEFVYLGKERDLYPVEYLFVGWEPSANNLQGVLQAGDKLSYVTDGLKLRLFVWKLHNAVNASIERGEAWYKAAASINTSRYWPNMEANLFRASMMTGVAPAGRLAKLSNVLESATKLNALRASVLAVDEAHVGVLMAEVKPLIAALDDSIVSSEFLTEAFKFDPKLIDALPDPDAMAQSGAMARNQHFTLN
mmetsp:Transcript_21021/g.56587  ORF Transcript_21021/g.56587 Transcript_21021/m.56587 type:complete len:254 (-) Transcript_21021:504-1265(-)